MNVDSSSPQSDTKSLPRVIISHGTKGSADGNWFPSVKAELSRHGITCLIPSYPTPEAQNLENWSKVFSSEVGSLTPNDILIGHSLGAAFTLRLLEQVPTTPVKAVFLIAGFTAEIGISEYDLLNSTFIQGSFDWDLIKNQSNKFVCISGQNDPYVPLDLGQALADSLATELILIENGRHLNLEAGYSEFPYLVEQVLRVV